MQVQDHCHDGISLKWTDTILAIHFIPCLVSTFMTEGNAEPAPKTSLGQLNNTHSPAAGQAFGGDLTWYNTGMGACGWFNNGGDHICAVSHIVFDRANVDGNPNHNPLCGRLIHIQRGDRGIDVTLVDRCEGCGEFDMDVSRGVFEQLGNLDEGRVHTDWWWI
ncbi:Barwin-related endoglucanase [Penicillium coprophilum]|uniref:Barwin-related endoglucanase n=1 Tax=Penicillium coprophilum TaxID=36646 RepID=UPI0023A52BD0|nr:Barwin-related endoglucanase [Penicillium coprophilum]KAJ5177620.1 Barwin-related endoglucanase [Penicillium coprophilum]